MTGLAYLATPYTKYEGGIVKAFHDACWLAARLIEKGVRVYSPIAHTHPIAIHGALDPLDLSMWLDFDEEMMRRSDALIVAHLEGWQDSKGIAHEIAFFERSAKPIYDLDPAALNAGTAPFMRRRG